MTPAADQLTGAVPLPRPALVPDPERALAAAIAVRIEGTKRRKIERENATIRPDAGGWR